MSLAEIKEQEAELSDKARGSLAVWLLDSLPPHDGADAMHDSISEATRRRDELDSGRAQAISSDEFWAAIQRERATGR